MASLRPPPYASAVSKCRIPSSHAASMSANAPSSLVPWPKNSGAEPTPPKLPQPSMIRGTSRPERPSGRVSISACATRCGGRRCRGASWRDGGGRGAGLTVGRRRGQKWPLTEEGHGERIAVDFRREEGRMKPQLEKVPAVSRRRFMQTAAIGAAGLVGSLAEPEPGLAHGDDSPHDRVIP